MSHFWTPTYLVTLDWTSEKLDSAVTSTHKRLPLPKALALDFLFQHDIRIMKLCFKTKKTRNLLFKSALLVCCKEGWFKSRKRRLLPVEDSFTIVCIRGGCCVYSYHCFCQQKACVSIAFTVFKRGNHYSLVLFWFHGPPLVTSGNCWSTK